MSTKDFRQWDLMTPAQKALIEAFNDTQAEIPSDTGLAALFHAQAQCVPDRIAVVFNEEHLTYQELDRRSNQLAWLLKRLGVQVENLVTLLFDRCLEAYIAVLATAKVRAAYLPLDPEMPAQRLRLIVDSNAVRTVLTKSNFLNLMAGSQVSLVITLDELRQFQQAKKRSGMVFDLANIRQEPDLELHGQALSAELAYVIFTSGSTGVPKGVMVENQSVLNLVEWARQVLHIRAEAHVMQNAPLTFDASVQSIYPALISGATLYLIPEHIRVTPPLFIEWLKMNAISHWDSVPSLWYQVVNYVAAEVQGKDPLCLPHLEFLVLGGEVVHWSQVNAWRASVQGSYKILNVYGPTEATVNATYKVIISSEDQTMVTLGSPLPNTQIYILDEGFYPCLPGVEGEIWIGGIGLARGYLNNATATDDAFVPLSLFGKEKQRLYRTGDHGRLLANGDLEFLGRRDDQVKIRGQRIELYEIEAALRQCPSVGEAAVVVVKDPPEQDSQIVVFYTAADESVSAEVLRELLRNSVLLFMIPHRFLKISELPLTANKKVDKQALVKMALDPGFVQVAGHQQPATQTERLLLRIWQDVLKVESIGIDANFFDLGGDSVSLIRVRHKCRLEEIQIKTVDLYRYPTIHLLAQHIDGGFQETTEEASPPIEGLASLERPMASEPLKPESGLPRAVGTGLPVLPMQAAMLYVDRLYTGSSMYLVQQIHRCEGHLDLEAFEQAVNSLVGRHEALRTVFSSDASDQPTQVVLSDVVYSVQHRDLSTLPPEASARAIQAAMDEIIRGGFDLSAWPLFQVATFTTASDAFVIVWIVHHIIMDGWSSSIIYRELLQLYAGFVARRPLTLPDPPRGFGDLVRHRHQQSLERERLFWRDYLSEMTFVTLPHDLIVLNPELEFGRVSFQLSGQETRTVRDFARRHETTLSNICLTAFFLLLKSIARQDDLTIGLVSSGRAGDLSGIEEIVGCLINTLPVRLNLRGVTAFLEAVRVVGTSAALAVEHENLSLPEITRLISADPARPLFEIIFLFQNYPALSDLTPKSFNTSEVGFSVTEVIERERTQFPLGLVCYERRESNVLAFNFEYNGSRFSERTIRAWWEVFYRTLCQGVTSEGSR